MRRKCNGCENFQIRYSFVKYICKNPTNELSRSDEPCFKVLILQTLETPSDELDLRTCWRRSYVLEATRLLLFRSEFNVLRRWAYFNLPLHNLIYILPVRMYVLYIVFLFHSHHLLKSIVCRHLTEAFLLLLIVWCKAFKTMHNFFYVKVVRVKQSEYFLCELLWTIFK